MDLTNKDNETEYWKPIPDYPKYLISSHGRLMGSRTSDRGYRLIQPHVNRRGYFVAHLCNGDGKGKRFHVHQLVLLAFRGPQPFPEAVGSHFDDVKSNNHLSNLSWATHQENMKQAVANGRFKGGSEHPMAKLTPADVEYIRGNYFITDNKRSNIRELADIFNVATSTIRRAVYGRSHTQETLTRLRERK